MNNILKSSVKKISALFGLAVIVGFLALHLIPTAVFAQEKAPAQTTEERCTAFKSQFSLSNKVSIIPTADIFCSGTQAALWAIKLALAFSGTAAILFITFGGYLYLTSAGNDEQAEKGKKVLVNAVIGLVVIVMSTAIVTIVSSTLSLR